MTEERIRQRIDEFREQVENQSFDEQDIRRFLALFRENRRYKYLYTFEKLCKRRRKNNLFKMMKLEKLYKERNAEYTILNDIEGNLVYHHLSMELKEFGEAQDIKINEQAIKEIILCIYSLLEFTQLYPYRQRFCFVQYDSGLALSYIQGDKICFLSCIPNIKSFKKFNQGFITDSFRIERIDGKLTAIHFSNHEILFACS